jgi:head-tail adaptor
METPQGMFMQAVAVYRRSESVDDGGSPTAAWYAVAGLSAVPCRIQPYGGGEGLFAGREGQVITHTLYTGDVDIRTSDQVLYESVYYNVTAAIEPDAAGVYKRFALEKIV